MIKPRECACDNGQRGILLYGVVSFDYTDKQFYLHAIDRTRVRAEQHRLMFVEEYRLKERRAIVRVETIESDHAFAQSMRI
jgi:hypothetical protein